MTKPVNATRAASMKKAAALVPLAMLSAAWTVSITGAGASSAAEDKQPSAGAGALSVPAEAIEAPASVSLGELSGATGESASQIISASSTSAIPAAALAAYQRAETVINRADTACKLPWQLVAAIGRIESNHGRANGNMLTEEGLSTPGIYGLPLNGKNGTSTILDTDAGQFDKDTTYDRAVGPMQFIPSTWSSVGVDADSDGQRNPQDINDAALATAVYLCSGTDDLSTLAGQRSSVYRYNHSWKYVDTVLAVYNGYLSGDFVSVPTSTMPSTFVWSAPSGYNELGTGQGRGKGKHGGAGGTYGSGSGSATGPGHSTGPGTKPGAPNGGTGGDKPGTPSDDPTGLPPVLGGETPDTPGPVSGPAGDTVEGITKPVETALPSPVIALLNAADAQTLCSEQLAPITNTLGLRDKAISRCTSRVTGQTEAGALQMIPDTIAGILRWLGL